MGFLTLPTLDSHHAWLPPGVMNKTLMMLTSDAFDLLKRNGFRNARLMRSPFFIRIVPVGGKQFLARGKGEWSHHS